MSWNRGHIEVDIFSSRTHTNTLISNQVHGEDKADVMHCAAQVGFDVISVLMALW